MSYPAAKQISYCLCLLTSTALPLAGCGRIAKLTIADGTGPQPTLPAPHRSIIPTIKIASAIGWAHGATSQAEASLRVAAFASDLDHPRWLYVLPNGDTRLRIGPTHGVTWFGIVGHRAGTK